MNDKKILYMIISIILLLLLVMANCRYNRLNKELNQLKIEATEQVDSLVYINRELQKQVDGYQTEVIHLEDVIDSLQRVKNKVILKKDEVIVSKSVSEGIVLLQKNLDKWSE